MHHHKKDKKKNIMITKKLDKSPGALPAVEERPCAQPRG